MANGNIKGSGSRPPLPYREAKTSAISIFFIMALVIAGAYISSGGSTPVDPNGPGGPPTLEPYFNQSDYPNQNIILPTNSTRGADNNLQLKTFTVDNCGQNSAMIFLVDVSGSMKSYNKLTNLKNALSYFFSNMGGKTVTGMYTFSKEVKEQIPINYYKDVKTVVPKVIQGLKADGETRTREGFALVNDRMSTVIKNQAYPGYKYNLILLTDGVPELQPTQPRTCLATAPDPAMAPALRCFAQEEDPRVPSSIPRALQKLGVDIYSINIYSPDYPSDRALFPNLEAMLKEISSPPLETHYYVSTNGGNLQKVLQNISTSICNKSQK